VKEERNRTEFGQIKEIDDSNTTYEDPLKKPQKDSDGLEHTLVFAANRSLLLPFFALLLCCTSDI
jgi:hypothetical protein